MGMRIEIEMSASESSYKMKTINKCVREIHRKGKGWCFCKKHIRDLNKLIQSKGYLPDLVHRVHS